MPASLRNEDYTDRELLHVVNDCMNGEPWASTEDIANALGMDTKRGRASVGRRLSWMVRKGWMVKNADEPGLWGIKAVGQELMGGKLTAPVQRALDSLKPGQGVVLMRDLGKVMSGARAEAQEMIRRQFLHDQAAVKSRRRRR